jgi:hypothetical protein
LKWVEAFDEVFIRDLITLFGGVTTGKFSPDFNTLLIGDATGASLFRESP